MCRSCEVSLRRPSGQGPAPLGGEASCRAKNTFSDSRRRERGELCSVSDLRNPPKKSQQQYTHLAERVQDYQEVFAASVGLEPSVLGVLLQFLGGRVLQTRRFENVRRLGKPVALRERRR